MANRQREILNRFRELLTHVDIKVYLYAIGAIAIVIAIVLNAKKHNYIIPRADNKVDLDIQGVAKDYNLDLSDQGNDGSQNIDYVNDTDHNLTNDLSRSLFLTNLFLEQNGMTDSETKGKILANIIYDYQKSAGGKIYTESDLNLIRNTDRDSLQEYFNDIDQAFGDYIAHSKTLNTLNSSELDPAQNISETQLVNLKGNLTSSILKEVNVNTDFINQLLAIPATPEGATYQLQLVNLISKNNSFLKALAVVDSDPVKYIFLDGDKFQTTLASDLTSAINAFGDYFKKNNITDPKTN